MADSLSNTTEVNLDNNSSLFDTNNNSLFDTNSSLFDHNGLFDTTTPLSEVFNNISDLIGSNVANSDDLYNETNLLTNEISFGNSGLFNKSNVTRANETLQFGFFDNLVIIDSTFSLTKYFDSFLLQLNKLLKLLKIIYDVPSKCSWDN